MTLLPSSKSSIATSAAVPAATQHLASPVVGVSVPQLMGAAPPAALPPVPGLVPPVPVLVPAVLALPPVPVTPPVPVMTPEVPAVGLALPAVPGMHRFVWDLRYSPPDALSHEYPISAVVHDTPPEPLGPLVLPGTYQVKLTAGGQSFTQPLEVRMDPRVRTPADSLAQQLKLANGIVAAMGRDAAALRQVKQLRGRVAALPASARKGALGREVAAFVAKAAAIAGSEGDEEGAAPAPPAPPARRRGAPAASLEQLNDDLGRLLVLLNGADEAPTTQQQAGFAELERRLGGALARWDELRGRDLERLNDRLRRAGAAPVAAE